MELMVHRRLLHDDAFGVGEALNETAFGGEGLVARGKHKVRSLNQKAGSIWLDSNSSNIGELCYLESYTTNSVKSPSLKSKMLNSTHSDNSKIVVIKRKLFECLITKLMERSIAFVQNLYVHGNVLKHLLSYSIRNAFN